MPTPSEIMQEVFKHLDRAKVLADNTRVAAMLCDHATVARLEREAWQAHRAAYASFNHLEWPDMKANMDKYTKRSDSVANSIFSAVAWLKQCTKKNPKWKSGGSFNHKGTLDGTAQATNSNEVRFEFRVSPASECRDLCIIQVYHIEKIDTGEIIDPPSKADKRADPAEASFGQPPRDEDNWRGYVVDAPPTDMNGNLNPNPCYPGQSTSGQAGSGRKLTGKDQPDFLKPGFRAVFETCVVCLDGNTITVLNSMRWIFDQDENTSVIELNPSGQTDWGDSSTPFREALQQWLGNHSP